MNDDMYSVIEQDKSAVVKKEESSKDSGFVSKDDFDKEVWAEQKKAERSAAYDRIDTTTERVCASVDTFKGFLDVSARFPQYTVSNTLLIFDQKPEATRVGDYNFWKRQKEGVKRGESGIVILEPGDEYVRDDGSIGVSYNTKKVFDVSQTTARRRLPRQQDERTLLKALVAHAPTEVITVEAIESGAVALFDEKTNTVSVAKGHDFPEIFKALAVELCHASLADRDSVYDRNVNTPTARAAAYVLAKRYSIDPQGLEPRDTPRSDTGSFQELRTELGRIHNTAKEITERMGKTLDQDKASRTQDRGGRDER